MHRKITIGVAIFLCFTALLIPSSANSETDVYLSLQIDNPLMVVNGKVLEVDEGRGTAPLIIDGRTVLPIRAVIEAFGGEVSWDGESSSVLLKIGEDMATLTIDSNIAYFNGDERELDVAPCIINSRTMLPIRFIAECFELGIAWESNVKTVHIIRDVFTENECERLLELIPDYSEEAYVVLNENMPFFNEYELIDAPFEYYGSLDELERCGVTLASLDEDMMPKEERGSIASVTPSGWINVKYDFVPGGYIYNRCHLIGHQLTGEDANDKNLITGTRYLNIDGMLEFENSIAEYVKRSDSRVMYRVTPVFSEDNLVAHGVLLEALTIGKNRDEAEDEATEVPEAENEEFLSLCVYCYNVQPGIVINYKTGESRLAEEGEDIYSFDCFGEEKAAETAAEVYRTPSGSKYHIDKECGGKNSYECTWEDVIEAGLTPCGKCAKEKSSDELSSDDF